MNEETKWVVIDNALHKNPTEDELKGKDVTFIYGGREDIVIQTWELKYNKAISFAYCLSSLERMDATVSPSLNPKWDMRKEHFKKNGIDYTPQHLMSITIPKSMITDKGIEDLGGYRCLRSFLM